MAVIKDIDKILKVHPAATGYNTGSSEDTSVKVPNFDNSSSPAYVNWSCEKVVWWGSDYILVTNLC